MRLTLNIDRALVRDAGFDESKHRRDHGKFASTNHEHTTHGGRHARLSQEAHRAGRHDEGELHNAAKEAHYAAANAHRPGAQVSPSHRKRLVAEAHQATQRAEAGPPRPSSSGASDPTDSHESSQRHHEGMSKAHARRAESARARGDRAETARHTNLAAGHRIAASLHQAAARNPSREATQQANKMSSRLEPRINP